MTTPLTARDAARDVLNSVAPGGATIDMLGRDELLDLCREAHAELHAVDESESLEFCDGLGLSGEPTLAELRAGLAELARR